ncbi:MAG: SdrD B-like domain-containing protein [Pyrinomonadaceae bacterium]
MLTADGSGIRNVLVTLTDERGNSRTVLTENRGTYHFADVAAGETYIISVRAKRYPFSLISRILSVNEELSNVDFVAQE